MSIELKALLVSLPLAVCMQLLLLVAGFFLWGREWNLTGVPFVGFATGFVVYRIVKTRLESTN